MGKLYHSTRTDSGLQSGKNLAISYPVTFSNPEKISSHNNFNNHLNYRR